MVGSDSSASLGRVPAASLPAVDRPRRSSGLFRTTGNRRVVVQHPSAPVVVAGWLTAVGRRVLAVLRVMGKAALALGVVAGIFVGGRIAVRHVVASPRFALAEVQLSPAAHVGREEVLALAGVAEGDRLLEIDTDGVAARIAVHPWIAGVRVKRQLPSVLRIDLTERRAVAVVTLAGLYLVDDTGRPFKRATMDEADGLPVITGVERSQYAALGAAGDGVFREAIALLAEYRARPARPPVSELNIDPRFGFTLTLLGGGAEIRLGHGNFGKKLARLDQIFEAVRAGGVPVPGGVRVVHLDHLDGASATRIPVRLAAGTPDTPDKIKKD